ncbi:MAG: hypothetical protein JWO09_3860 [Bacteroidetes bacterium]|nr:hypothetical protein [Bacteroidota bacterium]
MYKKFLLAFFSVFLFACTDINDIPIPDNVLPEEKMADIMVDVHLLEATMNIHAGSVGKMGPGGTPIAMNIYKKHQVSKEQFDESYKFYTENPERLAEIYQLVLNNLSRMQAEVNAK